MKKLALYFVSFCWLFFVGCSDSSPTPTQLTVMFNTNGGSAVEQQSVEENKKATKPADPTKDLYTFEGWYSDEALTTSFDFETPITANTTLYAKWTEKTFDVTYKSDANTEVGIQKVSQVTPTLTKDNFAVDGKYMVGFFSDEAKNTAFSFPKDLTAGITIYVTSAKDVVTPADRAALDTEVNNAIAAEGNSPDLNYINTEKIKNMNRLFSGVDMDNAPTNKADFNGDISLWNVSAVENMANMFNNASAFNGDISKWNVSAVTDMNSMFVYANNFSGDISNWNVSLVSSMRGMFFGANKFNSDISKWNVSAVENMANMLNGANEFNSDISDWKVSAVTDMSGMFQGASNFNGDISGWKVSAVTDMNSMFNLASNFNSDLSKWDVSAVGNMASMFNAATAFNGDISSWDVRLVTSMTSMFRGASAFNQDISSWEVSAITNLGFMFQNATAFDQDLDAWSAHLTLDDNGKFTSTVFSFKDDMFTGSLREDNPPSWY